VSQSLTKDSAAKNAARVLSELADALIESDIAVAVVAEVIVATSPVVIEYAMRGYLSE
jgi:signal recognition particle GTPase